MKKLLRYILFAWFCIACASVWAQTGTSCATAILLTDDYSENVYGAGVKWYMANSFDLPLTVTFRSTDPTAQAPEVEMDFTCVPGQYDDPYLYDLFSPERGTYIAMPFKPTMQSRTLSDGTKEYYIAMGESYRDLLLQIGISYNVEVYVKVTYKTAGQVALSPDAFGDCMEATWIKRGQSYHVDANDDDTHYIEPYVQWQDDSIRYIWSGTEELMIAVAKTCLFDPNDYTNTQVVDRFLVQPGDTFKLTNTDIRNTIAQKPADGGVFFCKFYSASAGTVKVEHIPAPPPAGGAVLLEYNKATAVPANSVDTAVYAIPVTWTGGTRFVAPTRHMMTMYVGTTPSFTTAEAEASYQFDAEASTHELRLTDTQLADLLALATDNYLFVRFACTAPTTITPLHYTPSECLGAARVVKPGDVETITSSGPLCALRYADWADGDMTLSWAGTAACAVYVADTCYFTLSSTNAHVVAYANIKRKGSKTWTQTDIADWADAVDADGYLYLRMKPSSGSAKMTFSTTAPAEEDPECEAVAIDTTVVAYGTSYTWNGKTYRTDGTYTYNGETSLGCDSLVTLHLTFSAGPTGDTTAVACSSFDWYGTTYSASGNYKHTFSLSSGLDSIVTLHLTIHQPVAADTTATACESFSWHGQTYTTSGDYTYDGTTATGCDSIVTLHLTIGQAYAVDTAATACGSYTWYGTTYTTSGTYTHTRTTQLGCDSVVTLQLTISGMTSGTDYVTTYEPSYTWLNGQTFTGSQQGNVYTTVNAAGCDSVVTLQLRMRHLNADTTYRSVCDTELPITWKGKTLSAAGDYNTDTILDSKTAYQRKYVYQDTVHTLRLTILPTYAVDTTVTLCADEYTWRGTTYTVSGNYTYNGHTAAGCDSIVTLKLYLSHPYAVDTTAAACDTYTWRGTVYTTSGDYTYSGTTLAGCDSIVTLHLTINPSYAVDTFATACDTYTWRGATYTASGVYIYSGTTLAGCDSVVTLHLTIHPSYAVDTTASACSAYTWRGTTYTTSGDYTYNATTVAGCDSVVTLHLTIGQAYAVDTFATACDQYTWHGQTYTISGDYTYNGQTIAGCDSTVTLHLTINPSYVVDTFATACDTYTWRGRTYTASGDYTYNGTTAAGCDSIVTLHLTINSSYAADTTATVCGSFSWRGQTYTTSGDYTYNATTVAGCDSVVTLHLTISQPTTGEETVSACDTYTWHGQTYTASGDYTYETANVAGCDSTVTLHLTINSSYAADTTASACDTYTWRGRTYTASGDYTYNGTTAAGCDSIVTLHLTILQPTTGEETAVADDEYTWHGTTYTRSGDYTWVGQNAAGCDSTVTLHLTINPCHEVIVAVGDMLILNHDSVPAFDSYTIQWLRDGAPMAGSQTDRINVKDQGGEYEAMLTHCVGTNCDTIWTCPHAVAGEGQSVVVSPEGTITVYPTTVPASHPVVTVKTNAKGTYYIYNVSGALVARREYWDATGVFEIALPMQRGLYILLFEPEQMGDMYEDKKQQVKLLVY